jgi:sulfur-oxidizing protein SoxY
VRAPADCANVDQQWMQAPGFGLRMLTLNDAREEWMTLILHRRDALALGLGAAAAMAVGGAGTSAFAANDANELIQKFTGGKKPTESLVKLDIPEIAENGATVPMTVSVDSPMTEQAHVKELLILADENPRAAVATFRFSPLGGVAEVNTRIRLGGTQHVIAIAKMNDGSVYMASKPIKVTIGGCGG